MHDPKKNSLSMHYDTRFFDDQSEGSLRSARAVLPIVFGWLAPKRVVDVGCGVGTWLRAACELGANEILGVDGDYLDRGRLMIPPEDYVTVDLERERVSECVPLARSAPFDLVMSLEVAEHLPLERASAFVQDLTQLGDVVLFSAAVPFQAGSNHVNEQWPEFWAILFAGCGFRCHDVLRRELWHRRDVEWWYAQNALLFVREGCSAETRLPTEEVSRDAPLSLVHPENLLFQVLHAFRTHRAAAREEEVEDLHNLVAAYRSGAAVLPDLRAVQRATGAAPDALDIFPYTRMLVSIPEDEIAWRDTALATRAAELATTRELLTARGEELATTRELLTARGEELATTRELLTARGEELATTRELLTARGEELATTRELLTALGEELATTRAMLTARGKELNAARNVLASRDAELATNRELLTTFGEQVETARKSLNQERSVTAALEARLRELHASTSWRLTAPVRWIVTRARDIIARGDRLD